MTRIVEADEQGAVHLDRETLGSKPKMQFIVTHSNDQIVLKPVGESEKKEPPWESLSPQERAEEFLQWVQSLEKMPGGPSLSDEALRRENMYD